MTQIQSTTANTTLWRTASPAEVREVFTEFVGQTFFTQLIKSMRSMQQKPAYFDGGRAEKVFQSQLDQTLAEKMTQVSADQLANTMFARQFPRLAAQLEKDPSSSDPDGLAALEQLRRR